MEIRTLNDIYAVTCTLDRPAALKSKRDGRWVDVSVPEFRDTVRHFATGLRLLGIKPGDRVAILSENRPEWAMADFAILANAAVTVPIYPALLGWQIEYILNDSGSVAVICSTDEQLQKIQDVRSHCPHLHNVIACERNAKNALTFQQVVESGKSEKDDKRFDELRAQPKPNDLATLVYTSGTTGNPKGAMLTHGNIVSNALASLEVLPIHTGLTGMSILPLSPELAAFFIGAGLEILEGYGLTETSPVIALNTPNARRIGTVGKIIPGVEVKIAADGEILARGPNIMKGYWNNPEATAQAIDAEGWFHTGDIGEIDKEGFLKITDRKKDIIINAYGKNIAPQPLEALLKSSPYIGTPVLIGDRRKYLAALLVPNFDKLERDASAIGVQFANRDELIGNDKVREIYQGEIDRFNKNLDRQEKIRRFALLPRDFSIDEDEITPSLKVKRKVIDKKYKEIIDQLFVEDEEEREAKRA